MTSAVHPVVLITGVSSGIGRATAELLARSGYRVYGSVRSSRPEAEIAGVTLVSLDVRNEATIRAAVDQIVAAEGRVDALVNSAGQTLTGSVEETTIDAAAELFDTNLLGLARVIQAVLPVMREQKSGRIVNIGSVLGLMPAPFMAYYAATKHAVEGYTESLDHEVSPFGIRAVVVEPSWTRSKLGSNAVAASGRIADYAPVRERAERAVDRLVKDGGSPELVARAVLGAIRVKNPRHRYPVGREARTFSLLRRFAPSGLFDPGLRKQFDLDR